MSPPPLALRALSCRRAAAGGGQPPGLRPLRIGYSSCPPMK